jgi:osmoprotectant transport system ATP-binding protein
MIKLRSVSMTFGAILALHETNLDVSTGDTTVLIGPSGCGKSTILKLIMGLLEPTSGSIEIDGERVSPANILRLRRRIG